MTRTLGWLPSGEVDLLHIYDSIAEDSPRAALALDDVRHRCEAFAEFSQMGAVDAGALRRFRFDRRITVSYAVTEVAVEIFQVRYLGQQ